MNIIIVICYTKNVTHHGYHFREIKVMHVANTLIMNTQSF